VIKKFTKETMIRLAMVFGWYLCFWGVAVGIFIDRFWVILIAYVIALAIWFLWRRVDKITQKT